MVIKREEKRVIKRERRVKSYRHNLEFNIILTRSVSLSYHELVLLDCLQMIVFPINN